MNRALVQAGKEGTRAAPASPAHSALAATHAAAATMLMRQEGACACGGGCPHCEAMPAETGAMRVSRPGDPYEVEADRIADEVMRLPDGSDAAGIERFTEGAAVNRSRAAPDIALADLSSVVTRGGGHALDGDTRAFMESRFGRDFSDVRVHTDARAAEYASAVNARAFTLGNHIVFGAGQYTPGTHEDPRLIAHELTHTIQQGSSATGSQADVVHRRIFPDSLSTIHRAAAGPFAVESLYEKRASEPDFVFFDLAQPDPTQTAPETVLDDDEKEKVKAKAKEMKESNPPVDSITLFGYASQEGGAAINRPLIGRRLAAVRNVLKSEGFTGTITPKESLASSTGQVDYRFWRCVEMRPGGAASKRVGAKGESRIDCDSTKTKTLNETRTKATGLISGPSGALKRLDSFIKDPTSEPTVSSALDKNIGHDHSPKTATDVRDRVDAIQQFIGGLVGTKLVRCGTEDEPTCRAGGAAAGNPTGVFFCPGFFDDPKFNTKQDEILIHESAHGSGYQAKDRAYKAERVILILTTSQALDNAQSLTNFILEVSGKGPVQVGPMAPDVVTGCDPTSGTGVTGPNEKMAREAIAWAERWNTYAVFGVAQTYGNTENEASMAPFFIKRFGRADRTAMAGIYDRYKQMQSEFKQQLLITCLAAGDAACAGGAVGHWTVPRNVLICPFFFAITDPDQRTIGIYAELAKQMPGVTPPQYRAYPELAKDYKVEYWKVT
jgi:hypothetical protein